MSGYIIEISKEIKRERVSFKNRYGLEVVGDLYYSINIDLKNKYSAIIVGAPYGGVKEQGPVVYADELAKNNYIVLTFDQSFMGDSEGVFRHVSSPDIFVENFSACVDFLGSKDFVNKDKIGVIGICGSGGFALSAAQVDTRIKAVVTSSMYDMSEAVRLGMDDKALLELKNKLSEQRNIDFKNGYPEYIPSFPEKPILEVPSYLEEPNAEWFRFYALKRGHHENARGGFTTTSTLAMMNFRLLDYIKEISPRPILLIVGDRAHSKFFSEKVYEDALEPKELFVVNDAEHIDLYDRKDRIPFEKINDFFKKSL